MKILITGGAGFIGYHLSQELSRQGHEIVSIDNFFHPCGALHPLVLYGDIRDHRFMDILVSQVDLVYHLAAQIHVDYSIEHPIETADINVMGTLELLNACVKYKKKIILASSSEVYGTSQTDMISETHPLDGQSPYAATKIAADRLAKAYHDTFGLQVVIVRNFNIFGEYQNDDSYGSVIAKFTRAALRGETLKIYGDGEQQRDYMHIFDAVRMYNFCQDIKLFGQPINMGTGKTVKIVDLARKIVEYTNSSSLIEHVQPRLGEVQRLCCDATLAKSLGLVSQTDFDKQLFEYIDWY